MKTIPLTQAKVALIDDEDYDYLNQWKWFAAKNGRIYYAIRGEYLGNGKYNHFRMHREILKPPKSSEIHHRNQNGLDNQRQNLAICLHRQNLQAQRKSRTPKNSLFKGVRWDNSKQRWRTEIVVNGKRKRFGRFRSQIEAAKMYDLKAKEFFQEYATCNFE